MAANKTYEAEWEVWLGQRAKKYREPMGTGEIRELMTRFGLSDWQLKRTGKRGGVCYEQRRLIVIGRSAQGWTTYHEIAHALAGPGHGHDAVFRLMYVRVVRDVLGGWWAKRLMSAFARYGLDIAEN